VSLSPSVLEVRTKDHDVIRLVIEPDTRVTKNKKSVPLTDLAVGAEVSVHAIGHSIQDASAREIIVAPPRRKRK
jgi:hypothetical protein